MSCGLTKLEQFEYDTLKSIIRDFGTVEVDPYVQSLFLRFHTLWNKMLHYDN